MKRSRLLTAVTVVAGFGWFLAGGCSSSDPGLGSGPSGSGGTNSDAAAPGDATVVVPDPTGAEGGAAGKLNPLCGEGACVPDDAQACRGYRPPQDEPAGGNASGGAAGGESFGGQGGQGGDGEAGQTGSGGSGDSGGETGAGGFTEGGTPSTGEAGSTSGGEAQGGQSGGGVGSGGEAGAAGSDGAGPLEPASYGCQVVRSTSQPERMCQAAGNGKVNAPCFSARDCQAGLACVGDDDTGRCLPYCCSGEDVCGLGTYCAERPLRQAQASTTSGEPARVPVCVPADDCSLEDAYPCPEDGNCGCKGNTACMVVRADGTTTCLVPGTGVQGQPCPCAWNHVCSSASQTCVKICRLDPATNDCGAQKCQASSELPPKFGVCVGPLL